MSKVLLKTGSYYWGGYEKPWYIPMSVIEDYLTSIGFKNLRWHESSDYLPLNVQKYLGKNRSVENWGEGLYTGVNREVSSEALKWVFGTPHDSSIPGKTFPDPLLATDGSGPIEATSSVSTVSPPEHSRGLAPYGLIAAGLAVDILVVGAIAKSIRNRKPSNKKGTGTGMSPLTLGAIALGGGLIYFAFSKKTSEKEIQTRYSAAMNAPTYDWGYYNKEIEFLRSVGKVQLANNVALRVESLKRQLAMAQKKAS